MDHKPKVNINKVKIIDTETDTETDTDTESNNDNKKIEKKKPNKISETKYDRPELTYTDLLTKKDIEGLLIDYERVENLESIPLNTHIRYFEKKDGELKFRVGRNLKIKCLPDYIILNNGKVGWSVQVKNCIFFRKISLDDVRNEYNKIIIDKEVQLDKLRSLIKIQNKEIIALKKELRKFK